MSTIVDVASDSLGEKPSESPILSSDKKLLEPEHTLDYNEELLSKYSKLLVTSREAAKKIDDLKTLDLWEIRRLDDHLWMGLPENMEELVKTDYLALLTLAANSINGIKGFKTGKNGLIRHAWTEDQKDFLQGLGVFVAAGKLTTRPKKVSGPFGRGLSCAAKHWFDRNKGFDSRIVKCMEVKYAVTELMGDAWAKKEVSVKKLIDNVLGAVRKCEGNPEAITSWIKPHEEIFKIYPFSTKKLFDTEILSPLEKEFIRADYKDELEEKKEFKVPETYDSLKSVEGMIALVKAEQARTKRVRRYVEELIDYRLKTVYSYKGNSRLKAQKRPLKDLLNNMKKTKDYLVAFNPSRTARLEPSMPCPFFPTSVEEEEQLKRRVLDWVALFRDKGNAEMRSRSCSDWLANAVQS